MDLEDVRAGAADLLEFLRSRLPGGRRKDWWRFRRPTTGLYQALNGLKEAIVIPETSAYWAVDTISTGPVFSKSTIVVPTASAGLFALLQSSVHEHWKLKFGPTFKLDPRYAITDCFETFPWPDVAAIERLEPFGRDYLSERRSLIKEIQTPLTGLYSRFHDHAEQAPLIQAFRDLQQTLDNAVTNAFGWPDIQLKHGFYPTRQGERFTIAPEARHKVLDRLLQMNHERYAEEVAQGLHAKATSKQKGKAGKAARKRKRGQKSSPLLEGV
jgi:hypothetical protein